MRVARQALPHLAPAAKGPGHRCLWPMWPHAARPNQEFCCAPQDQATRLPYCSFHRAVATVQPKMAAAGAAEDAIEPAAEADDTEGLDVEIEAAA